MLAKHVDTLIALAASFIIVGILYMGVERMLLSKWNAQAQTRSFAQALNQCRAEAGKK